MRVVLMHNPTAGEEDHSARDLIRAIKAAGHEVLDDVSSPKALASALRKPCDLVVVAGGDGTVNAAGESLAGTGIPFVIIPLGTANNVARSCGFQGEAPALIEAWRTSTLRGYDRARMTSGGQHVTFIECFGFGVFPDVMQAGEELPRPEGTDERLERDLTMFHEALSKATPRPYTVSADGDDLSGEYLMVEVMNIGTLGPQVLLAPDAKVGDGRLDLVLVGETQRDVMLERLDRLRSGHPASELMPTRPVERVVISTGDRLYHQDGTLHASKTPGLRRHFDVQLEPHALQVLAPRVGGPALRP